MPIDDVDLLVICTPKKTVEGILLEGVKKNAKSAVVYASGYSETGNKEDIEEENKLKELCIKHSIALMGPNCGGFFNFVDKICPIAFVIEEDEEPGKIGLLAQSGQVCISMNNSYKTNFSYIISSGNSKIVHIEDYLNYLVEDEHTKIVSAYIEGITQPQKFIDLLVKSVKNKKPVVILKAGRSTKGTQIASSHTGACRVLIKALMLFVKNLVLYV